MTRVNVEHAREMRVSGLSLQAIGEEFGVSGERIRQLVGSPVKSKDCEQCGGRFETQRSVQRFCSRTCGVEAYNERARGRCGCGASISPTAARCLDCHFDERSARTEERRERIAEMWADSTTIADIAQAIGTTPNALGGELVRMRRKGWDLPLRRAATLTSPITKEQARRQLLKAIHNGQVRRPARCERCGLERRVDGHHSDYSRSLYVEWLCRPCHQAHHVAERQAA